MLTGKLVRVRHARNKLVPQYLNPRDPDWLGVAEQLLFAFRDSPGRTRGELADDLANFVGEGPGQLVHQGLAKLLEDRCEFEVVADVPPDAVREAAFRAAATYRQLAARTGVAFDRDIVLRQVGDELRLNPEQVDQALFADLKDEQRVLKFDPLTPEQLLDRYNVALAQAVVLRSTGMEVRVWGETPARFRQLFRVVKFHRLICTIRETPGNSYTLTLDGPLSLFSSTQKYGLQLALFLPTLLHCKAFDLKADVRWGAQRREKQFTLSAADGLRSPAPDFGVYTPKEFDLFAESFRANVADWLLSAEPNPIPLDDGLWVPDFKLTHAQTGREVFVELFGFWRRTDVEAHYKRLKRQLPGQFVLVVSEQLRADEEADVKFGGEVYRYKRTPSAEEVAKAAARVAGVKG
jgi:predicted nuclease of restriction endonuclease-like RecB superfamily